MRLVAASPIFRSRSIVRTKTLSADALEALGAARLASLLVAFAEADRDLARRPRLALAGADGPDNARSADTRSFLYSAMAASIKTELS